MDRVRKPWVKYSEVEQGALLVDLSASLRRRLMHLELDRETAGAYRMFAHAARCAGQALINKHRIPFVPDPPFQCAKLSLFELGAMASEIGTWASSLVVAANEPLSVRHTALDLSQAGQTLERVFVKQPT